jgi:hypothetical protein
VQTESSDQIRRKQLNDLVDGILQAHDEPVGQNPWMSVLQLERDFDQATLNATQFRMLGRLDLGTLDEESAQVCGGRDRVQRAFKAVENSYIAAVKWLADREAEKNEKMQKVKTLVNSILQAHQGGSSSSPWMEVLQLQQGFNKDSVTKTWRKMVLLIHPDKVDKETANFCGQQPVRLAYLALSESYTAALQWLDAQQAERSTERPGAQQARQPPTTPPPHANFEWPGPEQPEAQQARQPPPTPPPHAKFPHANFEWPGPCFAGTERPEAQQARQPPTTPPPHANFEWPGPEQPEAQQARQPPPTPPPHAKFPHANFEWPGPCFAGTERPEAQQARQPPQTWPSHAKFPHANFEAPGPRFAGTERHGAQQARQPPPTQPPDANFEWPPPPDLA